MTLAVYLVIFYLYISIGIGIIFYSNEKECNIDSQESDLWCVICSPFVVLFFGLMLLFVIIFFDILYIIELVKNLINNKDKILPNYYDL